MPERWLLYFIWNENEMIAAFYLKWNAALNAQAYKHDKIEWFCAFSPIHLRDYAQDRQMTYMYNIDMCKTYLLNKPIITNLYDAYTVIPLFFLTLTHRTKKMFYIAGGLKVKSCTMYNKLDWSYNHGWF